MYISKITIRNFRIFDESSPNIIANFFLSLRSFYCIIPNMEFSFGWILRVPNLKKIRWYFIKINTNKRFITTNAIITDIVNDNLSTIEQDVLKQSIELGLVEPRFEAIAGALRAWIKPRWVYLRKDHSEFQMLKDSYLLIKKYKFIYPNTRN